jgi:hypothetical protein
MSRRRGRALLISATLLAAVAVAGCGRHDFKNDPPPPVPAEVSVKIASSGVGISPKQFGAGLVNFTIANLTDQAGSLAIHGPVNAESDSIVPAGTAMLKVDMKPGNYEASTNGLTVKPFNFTVGPERPSSQNQLLLP